MRWLILKHAAFHLSRSLAPKCLQTSHFDALQNMEQIENTLKDGQWTAQYRTAQNI